jgi:hypothetical protein
LEAQPRGQVLRMPDRVGKKEHGTVASGFSDSIDDKRIAVLMALRPPSLCSSITV